MNRLAITIFFVAASGLSGLAAAQTAAQSPSIAACPAPKDVSGKQLYGRWQVQFDPGTPSQTSATLELTRNPRYDDSLAGTLTRADGSSALVAGDVEAGILSLEESLDGKAVSASWSGSIVANSCGDEIHGTWYDERQDSEHPFVLRRQAH